MFPKLTETSRGSPGRLWVNGCIYLTFQPPEGWGKGAFVSLFPNPQKICSKCLPGTLLGAPKETRAFVLVLVPQKGGQMEPTGIPKIGRNA